jgi:hypothetical protein
MTAWTESQVRPEGTIKADLFAARAKLKAVLAEAIADRGTSPR